MGSELDLLPTLTAVAASGRRCALPSVVSRDAPLEFREWTPGDRLVRAAFGTSEPEPDRPIHRPAILLVPLLAFDMRGSRLGYGGGFYDRTLAALRGATGRVFAIGVAFGAQEMEDVPVECFDQPLDAVATEAGIRIFNGGAS
jgi:5-formyltetrahydrofolate cyclo-ligase